MNLVSLGAIAIAAVLIYGAGTRALTPPRLGGVLTAGLFALTPLLWVQGVHAPASLMPLPFVAGWLLVVSRCEPDRPGWWPAVAGICLGGGIYTSYAAIVMMPFFLALTIALAAHGRFLRPRDLAVMVAAFCLAIVPGAILLMRHPDAYRDTVNAYHLYDANRFNLRQGIREMSSWIGLTARSEVYYDYFNPAFLFMTGRVLLFPMVVLLPAGLYQILTAETTLLGRLSMAGFLAAPFAAALTADVPTPGRALLVTPFAAVVSAYGVAWLRRWRQTFSVAAGSAPLAPRRPR
jgi:hypothetical protein